VHDYVRHLRNFALWLTAEGGDLRQLTRYDIQQYMRYLQQRGNQPTTLVPKWSAIVAYVRFRQMPQLIERIPRPRVRSIRHLAPKSLTRNERNRVLRELERKGNQRNVAMAYVLLYTGLRVSELVALDRAHVEIKPRSGQVKVVDGKGGISRTVPLPAEARYQVQRYLDERTDTHPALFLSTWQQRISIRAVQRVFKMVGTHPHQFRHTYGRALVASGIDLATVAELMGHSDVNMTRRYAAPSPHEMEQAIETIFG
jgi:integrase/recombinase XerD